MGRRALTTLAHTAIGRTNYDITIQQAEGLWVVTYQGQYVNIVKNNRYRDGTRKYMKNGWATSAPAMNMASKLNKWFNTTDFDVQWLFRDNNS